MGNGNNRIARKTAGKGLNSGPITLISLKSVTSCSASHEYELQYLKHLSLLSNLFFKQNSSNSILILIGCILC